MKPWIGIVDTTELEVGNTVRLLRKSTDPQEADGPVRRDRLTFLPGKLLECSIVEVATAHIILQCDDAQLLAVRTGETADEGEVWEIAATREAE